MENILLSGNGREQQLSANNQISICNLPADNKQQLSANNQISIYNLSAGSKNSYQLITRYISTILTADNEQQVSAKYQIYVYNLTADNEQQPSANNQISVYNLTAANIDKLWYVLSIYMLDDIENIDTFTVSNFGKSYCPDSLSS